jgi:hypothetical protein
MNLPSTRRVKGESSLQGWRIIERHGFSDGSFQTDKSCRLLDYPRSLREDAGSS